MMDINAVLNDLQNHPRIKDAGMVLFHLGLVRSFDLQGRTVASMDVRHDAEKAEEIRRELLSRPGIVEITINLNNGDLVPGQPVMLVAVAGETRDKVFPVLQELIERIKKEAAVKKETLA